MKHTEQKIFFFLDIFFVGLYIASFVWTLIDYRMVSFWVPSVFAFMGFALIYSKILKGFSFVEKGLYWISQNVTVPRTKYNHTFWGLFFLFLATMSLFFPPKQGHQIKGEELLVWDRCMKDPSVWMWMTFILILNFVIGFYAYMKQKKNRKPRKTKAENQRVSH